MSMQNGEKQDIEKPNERERRKRKEERDDVGQVGGEDKNKERVRWILEQYY